MTPSEIVEILELHETWLARQVGGARANPAMQQLSGFDFTEAVLKDAKLTGSNLSWCRLVGADLSDTDMFAVDLSGADLSHANLSGADLRGAYLRGANLTGPISGAPTCARAS